MNNIAGNLVKQKREEKGLIQKDFASAIKKSSSFVNQLEKGETFPSQKTTNEIEKILGIAQNALWKNFLLDKKNLKSEKKKKLAIPKGFQEKVKQIFDEGFIREKMDYTIKLIPSTDRNKLDAVVTLEYDIRNYSTETKQIKLYYFFNDDNILIKPELKEKQKTKFTIKKNDTYQEIDFYSTTLKHVNYAFANNDDGDLTLQCGEVKSYKVDIVREYDYNDFEQIFTIYPTTKFVFKLIFPKEFDMQVFSERMTTEKSYSSNNVYKFSPIEEEIGSEKIFTWEFKNSLNPDSNKDNWEYLLPYEGLRLWWKINDK